MANIVIVNTADNVTKILSSDLSDLKTQNKKDVISAINEVADSVATKADKAALEAETAAREADIAAIKDGADIDSFADVETALTGKQDVGDYATVEDLAKKQDKLTFDDAPTADSMNPVTSGGVKTALDEKVNNIDENGGFSAGANAQTHSDGGIAIGRDASANSGIAIGDDAIVFNGGIAIGDDANGTNFGISIGHAAHADDNGIAIGETASASADAIQLGIGVNSEAHTLRVHAYTMMDADGTIPEERLADLPLAKTDENNNFTTSQTITGTLTVNGDIVQNGASYESHAEQLYTKNDLIKTRDGAVGGLGDGEYTGIEAEKYDGENNGRLVFDANGTARVGDVGSEQPLLTREEASTLKDRQLFVWNATTLKAIGVTLSNGFAIARNTETNEEFLIPWGATESAIDQRTSNSNLITPANLDYAVKAALSDTNRISDMTDEEKANARGVIGAINKNDLTEYVKNTDYATSTKGGVIKITNRGVAIKDGGIETVKATEEQIDQKTANYTVIVPSNLDYAVRSVLPKTADTIPATLVANTEYYAGELATVSFALPTTGKLGQYCFVKFDSGATATTLTVTGSYAGDIPTPVANKTYEIIATWNGSKWVCSYRGY